VQKNIGRNRLTFAKLIAKSLLARFYGPQCTKYITHTHSLMCFDICASSDGEKFYGAWWESGRFFVPVQLYTVRS